MARRHKITKAWCDDAANKVPAMYKKGLSTTQVVAELDICWTSWTKALNMSPKLMEAKNNGVKAAQAFYEKIGLAAILGKIPGFNSTVWIFSMKNRFGWRDKHDVKMDGEIKIVIDEQDAGA